MANTATGKRITEQQLPLAQSITGMHFQHHPELETRYGKEGREKCTQDSLYHLSYLAEAVAAGCSEIFTSYIEWAQIMLQSRKIPLQDLLDNLSYMDSGCRNLLDDEDYRIVYVYIQKGIHRLKNLKIIASTYLTKDNPLLADAKQYLSLLLRGDRREAQTLIHNLVKNGESVVNVYEYIFQATQYEVGLLWQTNKITVAHEHYCTAATQLIMASLYPYIFDSKKKAAKMMACTVSGDLHEVGIRMLSDVFELDGWDTYYMGASMPDNNIITALKEQQADVLAISVTMPFHISKVEKLIKKIRSDEAFTKLKIIVGGYPFSLDPELWNYVGADASAKNAKEAVLIANKMISLN